MGRIKSFVAGFLFCLFGLGLIFLGVTGTFKKFIRILAEDDKPATTAPAEETVQPTAYDKNGRIIVGANTNNGVALPSTTAGQTQTNTFDNNPPINPNEFVLPKNQPVGGLSAVHGMGGSHLTSVPSQYTQKAEQIHRNVLNPMLALIHKAEQDGIHLFVVSAFRSYSHQKSIWERKWGNTPNNDVAKAKEILSFSSFPGTSRHHWGTDVDFNSVNPSYWETGEGRRIHAWLRQNAPKYGFCQTYAPGRSGGYSNEAWHWSHMPTAQAYYAQITNPQIFATVLAQNVKGSQAVNEMGDLINYVTTISSCNYSSAPVAPVTPSVSPKNKNNDVAWEYQQDPTFKNTENKKPSNQKSFGNPENTKPPLGNSLPNINNNQAVLRDIDVPANEFSSSPATQQHYESGNIKMGWTNGENSENK